MLLLLFALMIGVGIASIACMFWGTLKEGTMIDAFRERDRKTSERWAREWADDHERRMNDLRERARGDA
jgi:hypothetical protein